MLIKPKLYILGIQGSRLLRLIFYKYYGDMDLEIVKNYNYLRVKFDENLNFRDCFKTRSDAASRAFGGIVSQV